MKALIRVGHTEVHDSDTGLHSYDMVAPAGYRVVSWSWNPTEDGHYDDATLKGSFPVKGSSGLYDTVRYHYTVDASHSEVTFWLLCEKVYDVDPDYEA